MRALTVCLVLAVVQSVHAQPRKAPWRPARISVRPAATPPPLGPLLLRLASSERMAKATFGRTELLKGTSGDVKQTLPLKLAVVTSAALLALRACLDLEAAQGAAARDNLVTARSSALRAIEKWGGDVVTTHGSALTDAEDLALHWQWAQASTCGDDASGAGPHWAAVVQKHGAAHEAVWGYVYFGDQLFAEAANDSAKYALAREAYEAAAKHEGATPLVVAYATLMSGFAAWFNEDLGSARTLFGRARTAAADLREDERGRAVAAAADKALVDLR